MIHKGEHGCPNCDGPCVGCWDGSLDKALDKALTEVERYEKQAVWAAERERGLDSKYKRARLGLTEALALLSSVPDEGSYRGIWDERRRVFLNMIKDKPEGTTSG